MDQLWSVHRTGDAKLCVKEQMLTPLKDFKWQSKLYGVKIEQGDITGAKNILSSLSTDNQNQIYFKDIQKILLASFESEEKYNLNQEDSVLLVKVAMSSYPSSGYAISIYNELTGIFLPIDIPDLTTVFNTAPIELWGSESVSEGLALYPNPVNDLLTINLGSGSGGIVFKILSMDGRLITSNSYNNAENEINIDVSSINNGVYLLNITNEDGFRSLEKVTI